MSRLREIRHITFLLSILVLVAGCGPSEIGLGDSDNGRLVELEIGQILVINLDSNPTTGFRWTVTTIDETILKMLGEAEFQPSSSEEIVGAGGTQTFRFEAMNAGECHLELAYQRPWEVDVDPIDVFFLEIIVR